MDDVPRVLELVLEDLEITQHRPPVIRRRAKVFEELGITGAVVCLRGKVIVSTRLQGSDTSVVTRLHGSDKAAR